MSRIHSLASKPFPRQPARFSPWVLTCEHSNSQIARSASVCVTNKTLIASSFVCCCWSANGKMAPCWHFMYRCRARHTSGWFEEVSHLIPSPKTWKSSSKNSSNSLPMLAFASVRLNCLRKKCKLWEPVLFGSVFFFLFLFSYNLSIETTTLPPSENTP